MTTIAFFNNKGGVGTTTLVYHLAWMFADRGVRVVAADLDPQANLSAMFLEEDRLEELWPDGKHPNTVLGAVQPVLDGTGDVAEPHVEDIMDGPGLVVGDLGLSAFEDRLSREWPNCLDRQVAAFRVTSAFHRLMAAAVRQREADLLLIDAGPNLGAINRAALIAAEHVVVPLAPDVYSLQGLRNLGPTLRRWREEWSERRERNPEPALDLPAGDMLPVGYVVLQRAVRLDRPVKACSRWMERIPGEYRTSVLRQPQGNISVMDQDEHQLATLKRYRSLMPLAMDAREPMFHLKPADQAIGSHMQAVRGCEADFLALARHIAERFGMEIS